MPIHRSRSVRQAEGARGARCRPARRPRSSVPGPQPRRTAGAGAASAANWARAVGTGVGRRRLPGMCLPDGCADIDQVPAVPLCPARRRPRRFLRRPAPDQGPPRPVRCSRPCVVVQSAGRTGREDHRQHRQDARRDPGHQTAQEPDQDRTITASASQRGPGRQGFASAGATAPRHAGEVERHTPVRPRCARSALHGGCQRIRSGLSPGRPPGSGRPRGGGRSGRAGRPRLRDRRCPGWSVG